MSRSSQFNSEIKAFAGNGECISRISHGLRSQNIVVMLSLRSDVKAVAWQVRRRKEVRKEKNRFQGDIVCGMKAVFCGVGGCKTGGLGDVLGGLPPAEAANGHRVMTISPPYDQYKDSWDTSVVVELNIQMPVGDGTEPVLFFRCYQRGVDRVFVGHLIFLEKVWGKTKGKIYGPAAGGDYQDNLLRFSLLCRESIPSIFFSIFFIGGTVECLAHDQLHMQLAAFVKQMN